MCFLYFAKMFFYYHGKFIEFLKKVCYDNNTVYTISDMVWFRKNVSEDFLYIIIWMRERKTISGN